MCCEGELETRGKLHRAHRTKAIVRERLRIDSAEQPSLEIAAAVERVLVVVRQRIPRDGVDREVAAPRSFDDVHRRIAVDLEAFVTAASFRLSSRERDVDLTGASTRRHHLVVRKTLTDRFDATDGCEQCGQLLLRNSKYLDVDVLRRASPQPVANPSSDHERAATSRGGSFRNAARGAE